MKKIKLARFAFRSTAEKFIRHLQNKFFVVGTYTIEPSDHERGNYSVMFEHNTNIKTKKILEYVIELLTSFPIEYETKQEIVQSYSCNNEVEIELYDLIPLDRETADKFIHNCLFGFSPDIKIESKEHILSYIKENGFSKTLRLAFLWYESDERYDYWLKIYMRTISQKEINEHPVIYDKYKNNLK